MDGEERDGVSFSSSFVLPVVEERDGSDQWCRLDRLYLV